MRFVDVLRKALSWVFPVFARGLPLRTKAQEYQWLLHLVILALVLAGLAFLNHILDLRTYLPTAPWFIRESWLPLLFLLIYALSWLGWWLYKLLAPQEQISPFPDLDEAWDEALRVLREKQLSVNNVPIFLVLGKPQGGDEAFFQSAAAGGGALAGQTFAPKQSEAPLRIFAGRSCMFITCASACLLGEQARLLAAAGETPTEIERPTFPGAEEEEPDFSKTIGAGGDVGALLRAARGETELSDEERGRLGLKTGAVGRSTQLMRQQLLENPGKVARLRQRLQHVCQLIARERWPHCPINGILLLVPFSATADNVQANEVGLICQRDLETVAHAFKLRCPVLALVCDMEQASGFREFIQRIPADQRKNRLGLGHPWLPALEPHELPQTLEAEVDWIIQGVLVSWIYKLFESSLRDLSGGDPYAANAALFRFICAIQERKGPLARVLSHFAHPREDSFLYGGCYLAGTGSSAAEQAFIPGVLMKLVESQDLVAWTSTALEEDAAYRRRTMLGYLGLAIFVVVVALVAWSLWYK